ncbi:hypothetical protein TcasGA2_TC005016 [Tribolium castaneum]|uniref:Retrotransposon gag domain-containing protein n=1 Tax=Tribolium castaneum TaxID=7070 RepID=D7EJL6_TRICA|nr:hypothetical protein TcasGA2_TC005016 [Tribolium castaneum]
MMTTIFVKAEILDQLNCQGDDGDDVRAGGPLRSTAAASHLITTYSGEGSIKTYINFVEDTAELGGWTELRTVKVARLKLQGPARRMVEWNEKLRGIGCTWNRLKAALIHRFEKKMSAVDALTFDQFRKWKQRVGETVTEFSERLQMLGAAAIKRTGDQSRDRWVKANLQTECLQQFMEGLAMPVQQRVMSFSPDAFEETVEKALLEEQIEDRLKKKTMQREIDAEERTESSHGQHYGKPGNYNWDCFSRNQQQNTARGQGCYENRNAPLNGNRAVPQSHGAARNRN